MGALRGSISSAIKERRVPGRHPLSKIKMSHRASLDTKERMANKGSLNDHQGGDEGQARRMIVSVGTFLGGGTVRALTCAAAWRLEASCSTDRNLPRQPRGRSYAEHNQTN